MLQASCYTFHVLSLLRCQPPTAAHRPSNISANGSRIRLRSLATCRKSARMTIPAVTTNVLQPFDVGQDFAAEIAFNAVILLNQGLEQGYFGLGKFVCARIGVNVRFSKNLRGKRITDAVNIRQRYIDLFIRKCHSGDTCHMRHEARNMEHEAFV